MQNIFLTDRAQGLRPDVVICVVNRERKILLGLKGEYNVWEIPQGGIQEEETDFKAAILREAKEELGKRFSESLIVPDKPLVTTDKILFPQESLESKTLKLGDEEIPMLGKKYYFCLVIQKEPIDPEKIEYSDFKWVSFAEGVKIAEKIEQRGKKRIIIRILELLKKNDFIN